MIYEPLGTQTRTTCLLLSTSYDLKFTRDPDWTCSFVSCHQGDSFSQLINVRLGESSFLWGEKKKADKEEILEYLPWERRETGQLTEERNKTDRNVQNDHRDVHFLSQKQNGDNVFVRV